MSFAFLAFKERSLSFMLESSLFQSSLHEIEHQVEEDDDENQHDAN